MPGAMMRGFICLFIYLLAILFLAYGKKKKVPPDDRSTVLLDQILNTKCLTATV